MAHIEDQGVLYYGIQTLIYRDVSDVYQTGVWIPQELWMAEQDLVDLANALRILGDFGLYQVPHTATYIDPVSRQVTEKRTISFHALRVDPSDIPELEDRNQGWPSGWQGWQGW